MKKNYVLGLDLGVASVGWGIIDADTNEAVDAGVSLFETADASKNKERRESRESRRTKRRKKQRLKDLNYLLESIDFYKPEGDYIPLELRNKGLRNKLEPAEFYVAIYNLFKHRGISYLEDLDGYQDMSEEQLQGIDNDIWKIPCEVQYDKYLKYGKYRGTFFEGENEFRNVFTTSAYERELSLLLEEQAKYYNKITDEVKEDLINLLKRKREYYIGPGNEKSRTNYGVYKVSGETKANLFDELRGVCSIYNKKNGYEPEKRASAASITAQEFNFINDMVNIKIRNREDVKFTTKEIKDLMNYLKNEEKTKSPKFESMMKKHFKLSLDEMNGYRIDPTDKKQSPQMHNFEIYRALRLFLKERGFIIEEYSSDTIDAMMDILTLNTDKEAIKIYFAKEELHDEKFAFVEMLTEREVDAFIDFRLKNGSYFSKWHSLSYKAMKLLTPEMLEDRIEQHTVITNQKINKT